MAFEFLQQLKSKEQGPGSQGEAQLKELDIYLNVKQTEIEDEELRRAHDVTVRELDLARLKHVHEKEVLRHVR